MACIAPPPPAIEITVLVKTTTPTLTATFSPTNPSSAPYLLSGGELDFSCFKAPIKVTFQLAAASAAQGIVFDGGYSGTGTPVTFADDVNSSAPKPPVPPGHHQFPGGPPQGGAASVTFVYHNDWDGGDGSHTPRYLKSKYGLRFSSRTSGYLGEVDPIVDNGGNQY
jgi:hypothetical protein